MVGLVFFQKSIDVFAYQVVCCFQGLSISFRIILTEILKTFQDSRIQEIYKMDFQSSNFQFFKIISESTCAILQQYKIKENIIYSNFNLKSFLIQVLHF